MFSHPIKLIHKLVSLGYIHFLFLHQEIDDDGDLGSDDDGQNSAFFTFEMLASTPRGVTFPFTVTFFAWKSMLKDVTPDHNSKHQKMGQLSQQYSRHHDMWIMR